MTAYRIEKIGCSYEVQKWGVVMYDGIPAHDWKTVARFEHEHQAIWYMREVNPPTWHTEHIWIVEYFSGGWCFGGSSKDKDEAEKIRRAAHRKTGCPTRKTYTAVQVENN